MCETEMPSEVVDDGRMDVEAVVEAVPAEDDTEVAAAAVQVMPAEDG